MNSDKLVILLANPNYAVAQWEPLISIKKDALDIITCAIGVANFPLLNKPYSLPAKLVLLN